MGQARRLLVGCVLAGAAVGIGATSGGAGATPSGAGCELQSGVASATDDRCTGILVEPDRTGMESLAQLAATGALRPHVSHTFPLAHAAQAHELGETGRTQGKLVLTPA